MGLSLRPCAGEPELSDPAITGQFAAQMAALAKEEQVPPWCGYIAWQAEVPQGFGGFASKPDEAGIVEIGYLTFPAWEGGGVASSVAAWLVAIAREQGAATVIAHTLPHENASTSVLRRNGFVRDGEVQDPDEGQVWRWKFDLG